MFSIIGGHGAEFNSTKRLPGARWGIGGWWRGLVENAGCGRVREKVRDGRLKGGAHRPFPAGGLLGARASGRAASEQQRLAEVVWWVSTNISLLANLESQNRMKPLHFAPSWWFIVRAQQGDPKKNLGTDIYICHKQLCSLIQIQTALMQLSTPSTPSAAAPGGRDAHPPD